ncbi:MAG: hypothetical protein JXA19_01865 [Anaerolineales bacterium]|nr:hypothetical protein [Anaerolineales bacterium]
MVFPYVEEFINSHGGLEDIGYPVSDPYIDNTTAVAMECFEGLNLELTQGETGWEMIPFP